jgi:selenocysteine lyase/cysteine desulfurase
VLALRDRVIAALGGDERHHLAPATSLGCMAAIPIRIPGEPLALTQRLLRDNVELPIVDWPGQPLVRLSAHLYNDERDAEPVIAKLKELGISLAP